MKTITLITQGNRSEVQPFLALATALQKEGYQVRLAAPAAFAHYARKTGLPFFPISDNAAAPAFEAQRSMLAAAQDANLIIAHLNVLDWAQAIAEKLECHLHIVALQPHAPFLPTTSGWSRLEQALATARHFQDWHSRMKLANAWRREMGLPQQLVCPLRKALKQGTPFLHAYSPTLAGDGEKHGPQHHLTGQWVLSDRFRFRLPGNAPSTEFSEWLYRGGRPVFFDLNGLPASKRETYLKGIQRLSQRQGFRAIISADWVEQEGLYERDIFCLNGVDHEWLFRHCAAIVHHGGSGTIHAGVRAGIPNLLCSTDSSQAYWGRQLEKRGIGVHLPYRQLGESSLEAALDKALQLSAIAKAKAVGQAVSEENGLEYVVDMVAQLLGREQLAVAV
ncbi:MAG: glycosyltransferase family 1 protein [Phaeodactylibacter sp.]|nr:glycosyltransferase family 1 protein [Phaeodactylibacter sp.]MCB9277179.1 glycosyltransferase family 1 protein [Lewinellaceae bacterium]